MHGAVRGDCEEGVAPVGGQRARWHDPDANLRDAGGAAAHGVAGGDLEAVSGDVVPGEVAASVEGDAAGEAGDEQLGGRGRRVGSARVGWLVDGDSVPADVDGEAVRAEVP